MGSLRIVWFTALCVFALSIATSTASEVSVLVRVNPNASIPDGIIGAAIEEAARIWAPYGVAILVAGSGPYLLCSASQLSITLDMDTLHGEHDGDDALGAIGFDTRGRPASTIVMFYSAVMRMAAGEADALGIEAGRWPAVMRDQVVGRALGRALAHEFGHLLLQWPHHGSSGLMRALIPWPTLSAVRPVGLGLTDMEHARLAISTLALAISSPAPPCAVAVSRGED